MGPNVVGGKPGRGLKKAFAQFDPGLARRGGVDRLCQFLQTNFMLEALRKIEWFKKALKEFEKFPHEAKRKILGDLTLAAEGEKGEISKPLKGLSRYF